MGTPLASTTIVTMVNTCMQMMRRVLEPLLRATWLRFNRPSGVADCENAIRCESLHLLLRTNKYLSKLICDFMKVGRWFSKSYKTVKKYIVESENLEWSVMKRQSRMTNDGANAIRAIYRLIMTLDDCKQTHMKDAIVAYLFNEGFDLQDGSSSAALNAECCTALHEFTNEILPACVNKVMKEDTLGLVIEEETIGCCVEQRIDLGVLEKNATELRKTIAKTIGDCIHEMSQRENSQTAGYVFCMKILLGTLIKDSDKSVLGTAIDRLDYEEVCTQVFHRFDSFKQLKHELRSLKLRIEDQQTRKDLLFWISNIPMLEFKKLSGEILLWSLTPIP